MGQLTQKWDKIRELFFEYPSRSFQIREISRLTKIPKTTVHRGIKNLLKSKVVIEKKSTPFPSYSANETYLWYRFYKKYSLLEKIYASGLVDFLEESFHPRCIILFGSGAKGEYVKESDLDIFILASERKLDVKKFENKINHKINLLFNEDFNHLSPELLNNILNGTKLSGFIKLK